MHLLFLVVTYIVSSAQLVVSSLTNPERLVELMPRPIFLPVFNVIGSRVGRLAFSAKFSELRGLLFGIMGMGFAE